jgi:hypothetical protein
MIEHPTTKTMLGVTDEDVIVKLLQVYNDEDDTSTDNSTVCSDGDAGGASGWDDWGNNDEWEGEIQWVGHDADLQLAASSESDKTGLVMKGALNIYVII